LSLFLASEFETHKGSYLHLQTFSIYKNWTSSPLKLLPFQISEYDFNIRIVQGQFFLLQEKRIVFQMWLLYQTESVNLLRFRVVEASDFIPIRVGLQVQNIKSE
jgi:hypothetical protein